jgi:O-antigen/teichoic acid export membrane protein
MKVQRHHFTYQLAKDNGILIVQYAVSSLIPLLLTPHIVRSIGLTEYGNLSVITSFGAYGAIIVQYSFQMTGPKRISNLEPGETDGSVFVDVTFAKAVLLIGVVILTGTIIYTFKLTGLMGGFSWVLLFTGPIASCMNSVWFLQSKDRFLPICLLAIIGSTISLSLGFGLIKNNSDAAANLAVIVTAFSPMFMAITTFVTSLLSIKQAKLKFSFNGVRKSLGDGSYLFVSQFVSAIYSLSGPIIVSYLIGAESAGVYSVTNRAISALMSGALLTHTAAYPKLAVYYINNRAAYWQLLKLVLIIYLSIAITIAAIGWFLREKVSQFLYGANSPDLNLMLSLGLAWLVLGIFGTALTGYLTIAGRSYEIFPLTLKVLLLSFVMGIPCVFLMGGSGWLAALVMSQLIVVYSGFRYWILEKKHTC